MAVATISPRPVAQDDRLAATPPACSEQALWLARIVYVVSALGTTVAVFDKLALVAPGRAALLAVLALAGIAFCIAPFRLRLLARWKSWLALAVIAASAAVLIVVAPRFDALHAVGRGSDQGTCIVVAAQRLGAGLWPYDTASMWSHNALSCGPAWVALHAPLLAFLPYGIAMLALLALSWLVAAAVSGTGRAARFITFLAPVSGYWLALANGNDFPTATIALVALVAVLRSRWIANPAVMTVFALVAIGVSHFRLPFLLLPVLLFPVPPAGRRRGTGTLAIQIAALVVWICFYAINPASFTSEGPMHVLGKFSLPGGPITGIALIAAAAIAIYFVLALTRLRIAPETSILLYLTAVIFLISAQNLVEKLHLYGSIFDALAFWEGTSWLTGTACFAAWMLSGRQSSRAGPST